MRTRIVWLLAVLLLAVLCLTACDAGESFAQKVCEKKGHSEVIDQAVAPTCTETGLTEGKHCSVCNAVLVEQTVVEATGHRYTATVLAPTKTEGGYTTYTCAVCGDTYKDNYTQPTGSLGLAYTANGDGKTCTVTGPGTCADTEILISPINPEGDEVTSVGFFAFSGCSSLTSITIPASVTSIEGYAFSGCSSLTSITIPDSVTSIEALAFWNCSSLTSITFGDNSQLTSIGNGAFSGCSSLTSITIPASVTSIRDAAFDGCSSLTSITIPASVTSIGNGAFRNCSSLENITVSNGNKTYHSTGNCLIETASKTLVVGCKTSVIPTDGSVTSIEGYAFSGCSSLTSITIPASVTSIGNGAFRNCSSLENITVSNGNKIYHSTGNCLIETASKTLIVGCKTSVIPTDGSVTSIEGYAFSGCSSLTSITIPASVRSIGSDAFYGCSSLTSVTFGENSQLTSIGEYAFCNCSSLTSVTFGENSQLTSIGNGAFSGCSSLTSITIPASVRSIGEYAFSGCSSLENITVSNGNKIYHSTGNCLIETASKTLIVGCKTSVIPTDGSVTSIGEYAFCNCSSLTSITIPASVTSIGEGAFEDCSSLTSIAIPDSVTSIGYGAFYNCSSLTGVYISDLSAWCNIKFGSYANPLYYAKNLYLDGKLVTDLVIPSGVTSIGKYAFDGCSSLTSITIPASVRSIGNGAFYDCSSLTSITFGGTMAQWKAISKESFWNYNTGAYKVTCTDGVINK